MIEISIEVGSGDICREMIIRAGNIRQALSIARCQYPDKDIRVVFPIKPETFFVEGFAAPAVLIGMPHSVAA